MSEKFSFPPIQLLDDGTVVEKGKKLIVENVKKLQRALYSFGACVKVENVIVGPTITVYEVKLADGVRFGKIKKLKDDLACSIGANIINIEIIQEKGLVGIEIENTKKNIIRLREIIDSKEFLESESKLTIALGKEIYGENKIIDLKKSSHILVSGTAGSGKSTLLHTIINSIIYKASPEEVKFILIDTNNLELSLYKGIPHLLIPVITDEKEAQGTLAWVVQEIAYRYSLFSRVGVKNIDTYNSKEYSFEKLPYIIVIIEEFADFINIDKNEKETLIQDIVKNAEKTGIYLIIATDRPSVDITNGLIKVNINTRVAFKVSSQFNSKIILDEAGAEKLFGYGDMLLKEKWKPNLIRCQCAYISEDEIKKIVEFLKVNETGTENSDIYQKERNVKQVENNIQEDDNDPLVIEAIEFVLETGCASTSSIQRKFKVGYARAGRIIDKMEKMGIISGYQGSKPREVLISKSKLEEFKKYISNEREK